MRNGLDRDSGSRDADSARDDRSSALSVSESDSSVPSRVLHRTLTRSAAVDPMGGPDRRDAGRTIGRVGRAPTWREMLSAAIAVGVVSGLLELGILFAQVRGLH